MRVPGLRMNLSHDLIVEFRDRHGFDIAELKAISNMVDEVFQELNGVVEFEEKEGREVSEELKDAINTIVNHILAIDLDAIEPLIDRLEDAVRRIK